MQAMQPVVAMCIAHAQYVPDTDSGSEPPQALSKRSDAGWPMPQWCFESAASTTSLPRHQPGTATAQQQLNKVRTLMSKQYML